MNKVVIAVASTSVNKPKLTKLIVSQKSRVTSNGMETVVPLCSYINQGICLKLATSLRACPLIHRCAKSFSDSC